MQTHKCSQSILSQIQMSKIYKNGIFIGLIGLIIFLLAPDKFKEYIVGFTILFYVLNIIWHKR
jgi:hypothetical protein